MLFMPNAGRGCEELGRCHTARTWSSALTQLKSDEMGLFSSAEEMKHETIFTNYSKNKCDCLRNIVLGQTDTAVCWNTGLIFKCVLAINRCGQPLAWEKIPLWPQHILLIWLLSNHVGVVHQPTSRKQWPKWNNSFIQFRFSIGGLS